MSLKAFFVTGTDTGIGKTHACSTLLWAARTQGLKTIGLKPVAAGCDRTALGLRNEDALVLQSAMTEPLRYEQINPVALQEPASPHIAARLEGLSLDVDRLAQSCREAMQMDADLLLIEGAGGWRVPVSESASLADLACQLGLPVVLVVGLRLGCINHAWLTAEAIRHDGLPLVGWIANHLQEPLPHLDDVVQTLNRVLRTPCLGSLPWPSQPQEAAARLDLTALLG
jgi:dethiobiotin synthetase